MPSPFPCDQHPTLITATPGGDHISKAELKLTDIADALQDDWLQLAQHLDIGENEVSQICSDYPSVSEQALVMLQLWVQQGAEKATG